VPLADGTVIKKAPNIDDKNLPLMADVFPTGFFEASNSFKLLTPEQISKLTVVVVGCGPVGLCAKIAAANFKPKHLFAVDSIDSRLDLAKGLGAEPLNFQTKKAEMHERIRNITEGRGADVVIEVVGLSRALRIAFDLLCPWDIISSIGIRNGEVISRNYVLLYPLILQDSLNRQ
jgi:threonine dehydrogenase-like Zn-dependent dehydrogenase